MSNILKIVRRYFPEADSEQIEFILWENTAYPCCSEITLERQVEEFYLLNVSAHKKIEELYYKL